MLARKNDEQPNIGEDMFLTYRYQVTISANTMDAVHGGHIITEFYIPSLKLCFNEEAVFESDNPRNKTGLSIFDNDCASPLTIVNLPVQLIEKIKSIFELHKNDRCFHSFPEIKKDGELSALFEKMHLSVKEGNCIRILDVRSLEKEKDFEIAYKTYGNSALIPYMLNYINGKSLLHQETVNRILEIIHSLDLIEKESLKNSLSDNLRLAYNNNDQSPGYSESAGVGLASFGAVSAVTKNPVIGIGAGLFAAGITFFKRSSDLEYQKVQRDQLKDQFFDALVSGQQASFKKP